MADKKISKEEAKAPDMFLTFSEKAAKYIETNFKMVSGIALGLLLLGGGWAGYQSWSDRQEMKATSELYKFESEVQKLQEEFLKSADTPDGKEPPKVDFEELYRPTVTRWIEALKKNSSSVAAQISAMRLVGFLASEKQLDLAVEALNGLEGSNDGVISTLLMMQKAGLAAEKNDWEHARKLYQSILDQKESQFVHPTATVRLGLVLMEMGDMEQAGLLLERASTEYSDSAVGMEAKGYLRLLKLKQSLSSSTQEASKG